MTLKIRNADRGFTLIELMITVAIIAVIAAIAIPAYADYVTRSRRADAKNALLLLQIEQEKYRANNPSYSSTLANLGMQSDSENGFYAISITGASTSSYTIQAAPTGSQNDPECLNFVITVNGASEVKSNTGYASDDIATCWQR